MKPSLDDGHHITWMTVITVDVQYYKKETWMKLTGKKGSCYRR